MNNHEQIKKGDHVRIRYHHRFRNRCGPVDYVSKYPHQCNIYLVKIETRSGIVTKAFDRDEIELLCRSENLKDNE